MPLPWRNGGGESVETCVRPFLADNKKAVPPCMRNCFEGNNNENCRGLLHGNRLFAVGAYAHGCDGAADELAHAFDEFLGLFRNLFPGTAGGNVLHPAGHRFIHGLAAFPFIHCGGRIRAKRSVKREKSIRFSL